MKLMRALGVVFDGFMSAMVFVAGILLICTMLLVTVAVVLRYFLHHPIGWSVEVSQYMLVFMGYLVVAWVLRRERHVKMDLLLSAFRERTQAIINSITSGIGVAVCSILAVFATITTWDLYRTGYFEPTVLMLPKFIFLGVIALAFLMLSVQFARRTYGYVKAWRLLHKKEAGI